MSMELLARVFYSGMDPHPKKPKLNPKLPDMPLTHAWSGQMPPGPKGWIPPGWISMRVSVVDYYKKELAWGQFYVEEVAGAGRDKQVNVRLPHHTGHIGTANEARIHLADEDHTYHLTLDTTVHVADDVDVKLRFWMHDAKLVFIG